MPRYRFIGDEQPLVSPDDVSLDFTDMPIQIGVFILGDWKTTRQPLEYLILSLNSRQELFEYQLICIDDETGIPPHFEDSCKRVFTNLVNGSKILDTKQDLIRILNAISCQMVSHLGKKYHSFDQAQIPHRFIYISTSAHADPSFFTFDGTNNARNECKGAVILTGHHKSAMSPPTVVEFIFKFIFRISIKWKYPKFVRKMRHYGQKGCLFDYSSELHTLRYMILHNYICRHCERMIGSDAKGCILDTLDPKHLYSDSVDRHPAKISADLGFNLSLTKGLYNTRMERFKSEFQLAFIVRLGSIAAMGILFLVAIASGIETSFISED